ncbi:isopenicillin N synthase family oxygenase [Streptomyces sp. HNM0574]|uniref:isopenicillin N synthase family dioxygenase n=1 Tax=Streptomyces sp. HNM0574 TaxID=2714954 RepID=UPI00146B23D7|nr:isopenicillin N synthase family oxygenase [Streptomyces sp. HNM0574]NLU69391.1 isopenicillin N synthase family oxygenase [Streptomyces sp. HNM0574]
MARAESGHTAHGALDVPVIDVSRWATGTARERALIAEAVDAAARDVGFMQITGHGVPARAEAALARAMDGFFALPMAEKKALTSPPEINRGYTPPRAEKLSLSLGHTTPEDLFEAFNVGVEQGAVPGAVLPVEHFPANVWPEPSAVPGMREGVEEWFAHAGALARRLTEIFALALGLEPGHFAPYTDRSVDVLRMNNYALPAEPTVVDNRQMGMGAHTDYGIVTVLWADRVPGLQILDDDGTWHDVLPAEGALLVNLGDALARWTNDRWRSTLHRVLPPTDGEGRLVRRRSAAFFHDGNHDAVISPLPGCVPEGEEPLYAPVTLGEHITAKLAGSRALRLNTAAEREMARLRAASADGPSPRA